MGLKKTSIWYLLVRIEDFWRNREKNGVPANLKKKFFGGGENGDLIEKYKRGLGFWGFWQIGFLGVFSIKNGFSLFKIDFRFWFGVVYFLYFWGFILGVLGFG